MRRKLQLVISSVFAISIFLTLVIGTNMGHYVGYKKGLKEGYLRALSDVSNKTGITFEWTDLGNGRYEILAYYEGELYAKGETEVHLWVEHWRDGKLLNKEYGAGVLTNIGKDYIEQQISNTNASEKALYCADSNDATDPPLASWTKLPSEITSNGLDRQTGAYTSTGVGTWNVSVTKTVTGTQSTQLWGLHWVVTDDSDNNLLCADSGPSQKNCVNGDTLKETWQCSVS